MTIVAAIPTTIDELGTSPGLLRDLVLRRALIDGQTSTIGLAEALATSPQVMDVVVADLRAQHLMDIQGLERRSYLLSLTEAGHEQATERMAVCRYAGPAPVTLDQYRSVVEGQRPRTPIDHGHVRAALHDLVVSDHLVDQLGPALRANGAIFLYGPSGTGKTAISQRLVRAYGDEGVLVPHAVEVDGQVVAVHDPVLHQAIDPQPEGLDPRWVLCHRPVIIAGGELTPAQLDLRFDRASGVHHAPLQMQANGGILVIDDFGRQAASPEQLLNRWIVPLDRGIDYLSLVDGTTFPVPCTPKIVFSTNLAPASLGDEAFYRRIRSKVLIPPIDADQFDQVLRLAAADQDVTVADGAAEHLRALARAQGDGDLRPYLPWAVCDLVESICGYEGVPRVLDPPMVDRVMELFLTEQRQQAT